MENNWKEIAENLLNKELGDDKLNAGIIGEIVDAMLQAMNLVFEATKIECADKAESITDIDKYIYGSIVNKESILNINKPNI